MATEQRQTVVSLDASLFERAVAYGAANGIPLESLVEQGLRLRLGGAPEPADACTLPDLEALADLRIREQLPRIVREWLESPRGAEYLRRLMAPCAPGASSAPVGPSGEETAEDGDVALPRPVLARLQRQRMVRLEAETGVDIPTLHRLRTGVQSRLPKEALARLIAGLDVIEADREADYELEGMHG